MNAKREIRSLGQSFRYAAAGFLCCIGSERNMRIHLSAFVLLSVFSYYYGLDRYEYLLFVLVCGLVLFAEMVNTAVEAIIDLVSPSYQTLAKVAKDVAAGAVLLTAAVAVIIGIGLFSDIDRLYAVAMLFWQAPIRLLIPVILIPAALFFIFKGNGIVSKLHSKRKK